MSEAKEIAIILKNDRRFDRIMDRLLKKYISRGRASGRVVIRDADMDECEAAEGIVCPRIGYEPPVLSFAAKDFEKGLGVELKAVLEEYYGHTILTNAEKSELKAKQRDVFEKELYDRFSDTPSSCWLRAMFSEKKYGYRTVMKKYDTDISQATELLTYTCAAVNSRLEQNREPIALPVLSASITGNSHYFDLKETAGGLLVGALAFYCNKNNYNGAEDIKEIYSDFGIEADIITGTVAAVGIRLYKKDGPEHAGYKCFADSGEIAMISAASLDNIGSAGSDGKQVFAVENPAVFTALVPAAVRRGVGLICTSGQLKMVALRLIDMLVGSQCVIYYAGDHDPEGIQIADKLISRYDNGSVRAWRMSPQDYLEIDKREAISISRLKILDGIKDEALKSLSEIIKQEKKSGYQELLIDRMTNDILMLDKN